jgi:hypothetical protein
MWRGVTFRQRPGQFGPKPSNPKAPARPLQPALRQLTPPRPLRCRRLVAPAKAPRAFYVEVLVAKKAVQRLFVERHSRVVG